MEFPFVEETPCIGEWKDAETENFLFFWTWRFQSFNFNDYLGFPEFHPLSEPLPYVAEIVPPLPHCDSFSCKSLLCIYSATWELTFPVL